MIGDHRDEHGFWRDATGQIIPMGMVWTLDEEKAALVRDQKDETGRPRYSEHGRGFFLPRGKDRFDGPDDPDLVLARSLIHGE